MATIPSAILNPYLDGTWITDRHITRHGVIQVPAAAADGTPPAIIKLHAEYQYRIVDFQVIQSGDEPNAPAPTPQPNEVIKYAMVFLNSAKPGIDGNYIKIKRGRYVFLKTVVVPPAGGLIAYPEDPYDDTPPQTSSPGTWLPSLVGSDTASAGADSTNASAPNPENASNAAAAALGGITAGVDGAQIPSSTQEVTIPPSGG